MADFELRRPELEEAEGFFTPIAQAFAVTKSREWLERAVDSWERERAIGVVEGGRWVAGSGNLSLSLTVPGGGTLPTAGVTDVGVTSTHRRRGYLTAMMGALFDDAIEHGDAVAALIASESTIYGRFGYGVATREASYSIEPDRAAFREPVDTSGIRILERDDQLPAVTAAYGRCHRNGTVSRSEGWWRARLADLPDDRDGASQQFVAVHDGPEGPDGLVRWRVRDKWGPETHMLPEGSAEVSDLHGADAEVEAALWAFLCSIDLVARVNVETRPLDDPLRWRLVEPRRLRTLQVADWLWVRPLDVATALSGRRYRVNGSLVVEVIDRFRPELGGRFRLDGGPDGAECVAAPKASADLTLGASELGSIYLGGVAPSALAGAGRIDEHAPGALARADLLFGVDQQPYCGTMF